MSQESLQWLNKNVLTGYGVTPWHYREGISTTPYDGPVPEEDVSKLFPKIVLEDIATMRDATWQVDPDHSAVVASRNGERNILQIASADYVVHPYDKTLLELGLPIATAGVLRNGGQVWVQYGSLDGRIEVQGIEFALKLLGVTSADGSLATRFFETATVAVCDNTVAVAMTHAQKKSAYARHTKYSLGRVDEIRTQYSRLNDSVTEFFIASTMKEMSTTVTDAQIEKLLNEVLPESAPGADESKGRTQQLNKRDQIQDWLSGNFHDYRNTKFGVLHSIDAARRWDFSVRGNSQAEAVWNNTVNGKLDSQFAQTEKLLDSILVNS